MTRLVETRETAYGPMLAVVAASTLAAMVAYAGPLGNAVTLSRELHSSPAGTTWILASMSVGLAIALVTAGVIADRLGRARVFGLGAATFAVANLISALAPSTSVFVAARIVAGIGAAGMIATGLGLVAAVGTTERHRARTATWWSVAMGGGIALGPLVTGLLDLAGWWRPFYLVLAAAGAGLWLAVRRTAGPDVPPATARRLDPVGFAALTATLTLLVTAIVEARTADPTVTGLLFGAAALALIALIVSQRVGRAVLIDPALFRRGPFVAATAAAFGTGIGLIAVMSFAGTFVVLQMHLSTLAAGSLLMLWSATSAVSALGFSRLATRIGGPAQLAGGLLGVAVGLALLSGIADGAGPARLVPGLLVAGVATGMLNAGLARQAVATVPAGDAAAGTGANNTARYVGSAIGITLAGLLAGGGGGLLAGWNTVALLAAAASLACAAIVAGTARTARIAGRAAVRG